MNPVYTAALLTYGAKVSHEQCLLPVLDDLGHELINHENGRNPSEQEDEDTEPNEATNGNACDIWLVKSLPWHDRSDVHEATEVQEDINTAVDFVMALFGLL